MQTMADDGTADQLLDYLASDGRGREWTCFADLAEWESLYNLRGEWGSVGRLARNLAGRGLADVRRASSGMQLRLTPRAKPLPASVGTAWTAPWLACRCAALMPTRQADPLRPKSQVIGQTF